MLHASTEPTGIFDFTDPAEIKERNWIHRCVKSKLICTIGPASRSVEVLWYDIYLQLQLSDWSPVIHILVATYCIGGGCIFVIMEK